jgi:hypothetical protein
MHVVRNGEGGKRQILKNTPVTSTEEVEKALRKSEAATKAKKKGKKRKGKRAPKHVVSSEDEASSSIDDSFDIERQTTPEILDCIEVAE